MRALTGKRAIITGGTAGIGRAIALLFAEEGASVAIVGTNEQRAQAVVAEMEANKQTPEQQFRSLLLDVSNHATVTAAVDQLVAGWGGVDILVNNAGITRDGLLMKMSEEDWDKVLDTNLKSAFNMCKAVCRPMIRARGGVILNISSVIGLTGNAGQINYAASKSGLIGFTKSLAKELAARGIRANCIAPGYIETPMTDGLPPAVKEAIIHKIPQGRIGQPSDIAQAALFLASDRSAYITGQVLPVDGGMVM
jgi:3-oxoacyl-[acyl-carrier protein] reductase